MILPPHHLHTLATLASLNHYADDETRTAPGIVCRRLRPECAARAVLQGFLLILVAVYSCMRAVRIIAVGMLTSTRALCSLCVRMLCAGSRAAIDAARLDSSQTLRETRPPVSARSSPHSDVVRCCCCARFLSLMLLV